jgi:hypothetical protein
MIKTIQGLPVYRAILGDNTDGMERISLVDLPAVESDFLAFDKDKRPMMFAVENEEKRIIRGVVMRADYPIYRIGAGGYEYFILFEKETIRQMAQKYLRESRQNEINLMHEDGTEVQGVEMVQWFIKDTENGISPKGFEEISDGSLFAEFKVENNDVWESVKKGEFKGFSLEGLFSHELMQMSSAKAELINNINEIEDMTKLDKIKDALSKVLVQEEVKCGNIGTDKGVLHWEGEETIAVDMEVWQEDEAGERIAVENGDYTLEDGTIIRVAEGKVTEIVEKEAEAEEETTEEETTEEEMAEETTEEEAPAEEEAAPEVDVVALQERVDTLETQVAELTAVLEEIVGKMSKMSMALPAKKEVKKEEFIDIKGLDRAKAMVAGLRKG